MTFNLGELENLFKKISNILTYFEKTHYKDKEFKIYLSNGDFINMRVPLNTLPHLLGIDTNYLISTGIFKKGSSFEIAKELCENAYRINKGVQEGILSYDRMFSSFIFSKLERFTDNIKINTYETEFVCKYDASRNYHQTDKNQKYDYIIVRQYQDDKVGILCLKQTDNCYVPMSNQLFDSMEECKIQLKALISYQPITLLNNLIINDEYGYDSKPIRLTYDAKLEKLDNLTTYETEFKAIIDVTGELKYALKRLRQNRNDQFEDNDIIDKMVTSISKGELIDKDEFRDSNLSQVIDAFNDFLCGNKIEGTESARETYSKLKDSLEELKRKLLESKKENARLQQENLDLVARNNQLTEENTDSSKKLEKIYEIVKPSE